MRRLRLGMVGGGQGAFIGAVHRIAARLDDEWELVAGALSSDPDRARASAVALRIAPDRAYPTFGAMVQGESVRPDRIDAVTVVTPNNVHHDAAAAFLDAGFHVICDKPMTTTLNDALDLRDRVARSGKLFALTHNYTGHPMVRQAREMVAAGEFGAVRVVQVEYAQDWLVEPLELTGHKQAEWRTDPARSGPTGALGDIGTHAFNLTEFITGLSCQEIAADLSSFAPDRRLDDDARLLLRFEGGARGMLWASQVAPGHTNSLRIRVLGAQGSLEWHQEQPNQLRVGRFGHPNTVLERAGPGNGPASAHASRIPAGHPEGYLEGFAQLYRDFAEQVRAAEEGRAASTSSLLVPGVQEGIRGVAFGAAALASSRDGGVWMALADLLN